MDDLSASLGVGTASNSTWEFLPSPKDLILALPRAASKAGSYFADTFEMVETLFGGEIREQTMAAATGGAGGVLAPAAIAAAEAEAGGAMSYLRALNLQHVRTITGVFGYLTSRWALYCFAVAIILNRTQVYSSTRRNLRLPGWVRILVRSIAIVPLLFSLLATLRGLRCQTSPDFSMMRYGVEDKLTTIDFSQDGGFFYHFTSGILIGESDLQSCRAVHMVPDEDGARPYGSLKLVWPSFKALCLSKFVETLSCAVTGTHPATETGMSLFEHSLAFAETESMVGTLIGMGPLTGPSNETDKIFSVIAGTNVTSPTATLSKSAIVSRFNTSPEVLIITLISLCNSLTSHVLAIFNKQSQYRLLSTGIWGICFLASFLWAFNAVSVEHMLDTGIFRFPTVCVVGFIPHLLIVMGIVLCAVIYLIALVLSALSPTSDMPQNASWRARFAAAYENMQANAQLTHIRLNPREDFYTALLRLGLTTLTAAHEAVFLNEGRHINLGQMTWLEEERLLEFDRARRDGFKTGSMFAADPTDQVASGVQFVESTPQGLVNSDRWQSGYSKERTTKLLKTHDTANGTNEGVGTYQRSNRYAMALRFLFKIFWLVTGWQLLALNKVLSAVGVKYRPAWMKRAIQGPIVSGATVSKVQVLDNKKTEKRDFWILSDDGVFGPPQHDNVDVASEMRKRMENDPRVNVAQLNQELDARTYTWFKENRWWGQRDESGDYVPPAQDDDLTSMVSFSTDTTDAMSTDGENDDGRQTPTQQDYHDSHANEVFNSHDLARLLDPQDLETRREARILAKHLSTDGVVTRSGYQKMHGDPSMRLLTSTRNRPPGFEAKSKDGALTPQEEAEVLEHLLVKLRKEKGDMRRPSHDHDAFQGGPQCVVCQSAPRTIMAWPCRCLSLCEDCRVNLAMNNFAACVCCRQKVVGFSRLFVP